MEAFKVISPGPMTTIQDLGRFSFMDRGVPPSGTLDSFSCRVANTLVGNGHNCAVLETTFMGPSLEALCDMDIALTGADSNLTVNGNKVEGWRSHSVKSGDVIRIASASSGCRGYLALTGGIDVPVVMGSRSTFVRARIGGIEGRALIKGDILGRGPGGLLKQPRILPQELIPKYTREITLRAIPGPQDRAFREEMTVFFSSVYEVSAQTDRMGCRLKGHAVRHDPGAPRSIVTEATVPGNIQVPEDGLPIILLVEQTTGGYTKIATVISTDISLLAQALPGHKAAFERVSVERAHELYRGQMRLISTVTGLFD